MAINLRCYTKLSTCVLQSKLDQVLCQHQNVFSQHYILYKARPLGIFDKEISNEFGLDPESYFYISVNNKALEIPIIKVVNIIKEELGEDNVIILLDGEDLI
jgi:hypothetical protein